MVSKSPIGVVVAAGAGLALGLGFVRLGPGKRRKTTPMNTASSDSILLIEPILDRLDGIDARLSAVESRAIPANSVSLTEPDPRFQQQTKDIETLQAQMSETRQRIAADALLVERRFAEVSREDPAVVQSMLDTTLSLRVEDLRVRLQAEMLESVESTLAGFERTIDDKVSSRISTIEKALTDQSAMIAALSRRETESDAHLQRLISAVDRLCERSDSHSIVPMPTVEPPFLDQPFERHLH